MKKKNNLHKIVEDALLDSKAQDIATLDLSNKSSLCDAMFIATGTSSRHVSAIVTNLQKALKKVGFYGLMPDGSETSSWVVLDAGDVIVHVFQPEARDKYRLEELWSMR